MLTTHSRPGRRAHSSPDRLSASPGSCNHRNTSRIIRLGTGWSRVAKDMNVPATGCRRVVEDMDVRKQPRATESKPATDVAGLRRTWMSKEQNVAGLRSA